MRTKDQGISEICFENQSNPLARVRLRFAVANVDIGISPRGIAACPTANAKRGRNHFEDL